MKLRKRLLIWPFLFLVLLQIGCRSHTGTKKLNKKTLSYFYDELIEEERAGKPPFPVGNTWTNYWKTRFELLRSESTADYNYEDVIQRIKTMRNKSGLPPIE